MGCWLHVTVFVIRQPTVAEIASGLTTANVSVFVHEAPGTISAEVVRNLQLSMNPRDNGVLGCHLIMDPSRSWWVELEKFVGSHFGLQRVIGARVLEYCIQNLVRYQTLLWN